MCLGKVSLEPELSTLTSTAMLVSSLVIDALPESVLEKKKAQYHLKDFITNILSVIDRQVRHVTVVCIVSFPRTSPFINVSVRVASVLMRVARVDDMGAGRMSVSSHLILMC